MPTTTSPKKKGSQKYNFSKKSLMTKEAKTVKSKTTKKVAKKVTTEVAKKKEVDMSWASATNIANMQREDISAAGPKKMVMLASKVFELPVQGLTILGGQPYINKTGWSIKRHQKLEGSRFEIVWHHLATPNEKYAIVEAKLLDKDGNVIGQAIGEATEANIKLAAVKQTLNMMAETRAKNRAMSDALTGKIYVEAVEKMNEMIKQQKMTDHEANAIGEAARTTAEEMNETETKVNYAETVPQDQKAPLTSSVPQGNGTPEGNGFVDQVKVELVKAGAQNEWQALEKLFAMTGIQITKITELSEKDAQVALVKIKMYNSNKQK